MAPSTNPSNNNNNVSPLPNPGKPAQQQPEQPKVNDMIIPFLEPDAYQRLTRILMVKPERVRQVEQYVAMLAQQGQLQQHKISDTELKSILDGISRNENASSNENKTSSSSSSNIRSNGTFAQGIVINRRGGFMDDSDDDLDFDMPTTTTNATTTTTTTTTTNTTRTTNQYNNAQFDDSDDDFFD